MLTVSHTGRSAAKGVSRDDYHFALFRTFVTFSFTPGSSPFVNSMPGILIGVGSFARRATFCRVQPKSSRAP
jgi:hypothetical protein